MIWTSSPKRRLQLTLGLLLGLAVIASILAGTHGSKPKLGASYTGTVVVATPAGRVVQHLPISFAIADSGHEVDGLRFPAGLPSACAAARLGTVRLAAGAAAITSPSRFRLSLAITTGDRRVGTLEIGGSFGIFNHAGGAVGTTYSAPSLRRCDASGGYITKAAS